MRCCCRILVCDVGQTASFGLRSQIYYRPCVDLLIQALALAAVLKEIIIAHFWGIFLPIKVHVAQCRVSHGNVLLVLLHCNILLL